MSLNEQKTLGEKIRQARAVAHISQIDMAKIIGIGKNSMIDTEKGRRSVSTIELKKIAEATGKPLEFFYKEEKPESKPDKYIDVSDLDSKEIEIIKATVDKIREVKKERSA